MLLEDVDLSSPEVGGDVTPDEEDVSGDMGPVRLTMVADVLADEDISRILEAYLNKMIN